MISQNSLVRVKKIDTVPNPDCEAASWDEYEQGRINVESPPVLYTVKGNLLSDIEEDNFLTIERFERNGVKKYGVMRTSRIQSVRETKEGDVIIHTRNSVYKISDISDEYQKEDQEDN